VRRGLRSARALLVAAAGCCAFAAAIVPHARAQENPEGPGPAKAPAPPEDRLSLRAIDLSAMYEASQRGARQPDEVPLASRTVTALWRVGTKQQSAEFVTDADGRFELPTAGIARGTAVEFLVPDTGSASRWPLYSSVPLTIGEPAPSGLAFVRVHDTANPLAVTNLQLVATVPDREESLPSLRVNVIAALENRSERLWIGSKEDVARGTFRFRMPGDFTLVGAQVAGRDVAAEKVPRPDGGADVVLHERIWPTAFSDQPTGLRLILTAPYRAEEPYDFSFEAEVPIENFRLNVESGVLTYTGGEGAVKLENAGANPEIQGRVTIGWTAGHIHRGQKVAVRFGTPSGISGWFSSIHPNVWYTLGTLALVIAGAYFLARALARRTAAPAAASGPATLPADERDAKIRELDRRLAKGEITSFEHAARKKQLEDGPRRAAPAPKQAPAGDANSLDAISARVDKADAETLRRDVRSLLAMLRGRGE
jgi:hypothetical protein